MEIVFATNNQNKLFEVQKMMPQNIKLLSLNDINCHDEIEETASTLEGNAQLKADFITQNYGYNCFADDTGLEVDFLQGNPGVYSARYAGIPSNAENNMQKLLKELGNTNHRSAQFRTVIALNLKGQKYLFEGICKGEILHQQKGEKGFGYDPIFKPLGFDVSFAEMDIITKNNISHRGLAIQKLIEFLSQ